MQQPEFLQNPSEIISGGIIFTPYSDVPEAFSLHDATLKSIEFEWASAVCRIIIGLAGQVEAAIIFRGVTWIALPKENPWGPSVSINELRQTDATKFEVEIQSGDVLQIHAKTMELQKGEPRKEL